MQNLHQLETYRMAGQHGTSATDNHGFSAHIADGEDAYIETRRSPTK